MRIGIYLSQNKNNFSKGWVEYCQNNNIDYKLVNVYANDIIEQLADCDCFMWHFSHSDNRDLLFAKQLLFSLQQSGLKVFPDFNTIWHFDDKVGQKYLFEAIGAYSVPSHIFYSKNEALEWIERTSFPKVFKLRSGAGSVNVKLVKTKLRARRIIHKAFNKGFSQFDRFGNLKERYLKWKQGKDTFIGVCKGLIRIFIPTEFAKKHHREKGYVYFQDFVPSNSFDIRVVVVGNKAFALKRKVRKGDFRASGSGNIIYDKNQIDVRCIKIAFEVNNKIKSQSIAYDFIFDSDNQPLIIEISYGYTSNAYFECQGYWDNEIKWHEGENFNFRGWMIENVLNEIKKNN